MSNPMPITPVNGHLINSVQEQIEELQPGLEKQIEIVTILAGLKQLRKKVSDFMVSAALAQDLDSVTLKVADIETGVETGNAGLSNFGGVLVDLYSIQQMLEKDLQFLIDKAQATPADKDNLEHMLLGIIASVRQLLNYRPDVGAILDDLTAIKNLRGGPADATAFHDFQVLQLAFRNVWLHAFDENLKSAVMKLYEETVRLYDDAGLSAPNLGPIGDIDQLQEFLNGVRNMVSDDGDIPTMVAPIPMLVIKYFPKAISKWPLLSEDQQMLVSDDAAAIDYHENNPGDPNVKLIRQDAEGILDNPQGKVSRIAKLIIEIDSYLSEPYAFDVFAPDSYNYGLMITFRQKWEPGEYQAGDLVATIPLAPSETRKFSKKRVVKTSRAEKELEKSVLSRSLQSSEISRAETEIFQKVTSATNFKLTAQGSFNIGIGSIDATSEFSGNQSRESSLNKKAFHEATIRAAEEYRQERSIEIDTTSSVETEETVSGEISNPNNEITVTYLFYELQRRYKINEFLYRVRPVILVAQDVPSPHEIDEAWLIQNQWILSRVLLDDSLRPALDYLNSGYAGDEVSIEVRRAHWERQRDLATALEAQVQAQISQRDMLRETLINTALDKSIAQASTEPLALQIASLGLVPDPAEKTADILEAHRKAVEARLNYAEEALAVAQDKLSQATSAFEQATKDYAEALQNQYNRHVAIDQLRVHVKQNILFYMQAIWDHEPPDQRFFRLYNKKVVCPQPDPSCPPIEILRDPILLGTFTFHPCSPVAGPERELVEIADLDNPLGYKGNYIIFPLKDDCYLTRFMQSDFINNYLGVQDADGSDGFDAEVFDKAWNNAVKNNDPREQDKLKNMLTQYISAVRRSTDEIIIPTGQLFIEALPGSHPLLEDFKLLHRFEDVRKVKAEVRHAELENLRLAARLLEGERQDPDVDKKIVVQGVSSVSVGTE